MEKISKPFFSFILPIYKVENYLKQCLDSILSQDFKDFELILVDDGSPDNSGKICDEYSEKYNNVFTFHKENGGLSDARNYGLKEANGEYVLFVDSDDFIFENSLMNIASFCKESKSDLIFFKSYKYFGNNTDLIAVDQDINVNNLKSKDEILEYISSLKKFPTSAWGKALRKDFLIENSLFFEKGLLSEDIDWMIRVLQKINSASSLNIPYYYYRQNRQDSITNSITSKNINSILKILSIHAKKNCLTTTDKYINNFLAYEYIILLANYNTLTKEEKSKVTSNVYEYKWLLKYKNNPKVKLIYYIKNIFGIKLTSKILSFYLIHR